MKFDKDRNILPGADGKIRIQRTSHGTMEIRAKTPRDLAQGLGVVHGLERQLHTLLMRIILQGTAAEHLAGDQAMIDLDLYMRRYDLLPDPQAEVQKLQPAVKEQLEAYCAGYNLVLEHRKPVWEMRLLGYRPPPWRVIDCLLLAKAFGFIGLIEAQGAMEKFLLQMIQKGVDQARLRELFPYLSEEIDYDLLGQIKLDPPVVPAQVRWLAALPKFNASNNWVVSGAHTQSGLPLVCGDPHLEVNRLPGIWQEVIMRLPDNNLLGVTIPGMPGLVLGRTDHLAWSATYSFMDMIDYRIQRCKNGHYEHQGVLKPFQERPQTIGVKKGKPREVVFYENPHGVLEGDPHQQGLYLTMGWAGRQDCGADLFNTALNLDHARTVQEAMGLLQGLHCAPFCWAIGDSSGNIGFQMSGRYHNHPPGVSGLLPTPGWDSAFDPDGYIQGEALPSQYNPEDGIIVTANNDLNHLGQSDPINLPMGAYRAQRIEQLLRQGHEFTVADMKRIHQDLYSLQAERLMAVITPLLPQDAKGDILRNWDFTYRADSRAATLFESIYRKLITVVFGQGGVGEEVVDYLFAETGVFNDYYANFDDILLQPESTWYGQQGREELFKQAVAAGLQAEAAPYGSTRRVVLAHLLFGGKLPRWLGWDRGPIELPGSRATIPQGQIFNSGGRQTTFSPSYRMISDMATREMHSNITGGSSDRRWSQWYNNETANWLAGVYKVLR